MRGVGFRLAIRQAGLCGFVTASTKIHRLSRYGKSRVAQPLLAVRFCCMLQKPHSQEWLCYLNRLERTFFPKL